MNKYDGSNPLQSLSK